MQQFEGETLDGRYLLKRVVDAGNFGAVFDAVDVKFDSRVAVKILFESAVEDGTFRGEALLARRFRHPNVVEVYEFGTDEEHNASYIVMEFLHGLRGDQLIAEREFQPRLFCRFVHQIGSALETAHSRQLIHRDLKPQNVMLVDRDQPTERFVLLDLGVASKTDSLTTLRNKALDGAMSPQYASPEQVQGEEVDHRSDVYSFGTILYEWLTGQPPFQSPQLLALVNAICSHEPPYPSDVSDREIDPDIERLVLQCLHKNPAKRPQSIGEIRKRVLEAMAPESLLDSGSNILSLAPTGTQGTHTPAMSETLGPPGDTSEKAIATDIVKRRPEAPEWQRTDHSPKPTTWKLATGLLVLAAIVALGLIFQGGGASPPKLSLPASIDVPAGGEKVTALNLLYVADDADVNYEFTDVPTWLNVAVLPGSTSPSASLSLKAKLIASAKDATITVQATVDGITVEESVLVRFQAPTIWVPDGFAAVDSPLAEIKARDVVVPSIISREVASESVRLLLITPQSRRVPFYIMENKVWNALLLAFADETDELPPIPENQRNGWRMGAMTVDGNLEEPIGIVGPDVARLPVMNLTAFQAHSLAQWLGGSSAHLPSATEWDVAAGSELHAAGKLDPVFATGPYQRSNNRPDVSVNRKNGPRNVGEAEADISPFGCRDMAGNGEELTRSTDSGRDVPRCDLQANVYTRGRSYTDDAPLTWQDLDLAHRPGTASTVPADTPDPKIGFRIVLDIEPGDSEKK